MRSCNLYEALMCSQNNVQKYYDLINQLADGNKLFKDESTNAWIIIGYDECRRLMESDFLQRRKFSLADISNTDQVREIFTSAEQIIGLQMIYDETKNANLARQNWARFLASGCEATEDGTFCRAALDALLTCPVGTKIDLYEYLLRRYVSATIANKLRLSADEWVSIRALVDHYVAFFDGKLLDQSEVLSAMKAVVSLYVSLYQIGCHNRIVEVAEKSLQDVANYMLVLVAGQESAAYLLGTILCESRQYGGVLKFLNTYAKRFDALVDEALRFDSPI